MVGLTFRAIFTCALFAFLMGFGLAPNATAQEIGPPHIVYGDLTTSDGATPDDGDVGFEAYLTSRAEGVLTETDPGCGIENGRWYVEVGNFKTPWQGKTLHFVVINETTNEKSMPIEISLTNQGSQQEEDAVLPPGGGAGGNGDDDDDDDDIGDSGETNNCFIGACHSSRAGWGFWLLTGVLVLAGIKAGAGRFVPPSTRNRAFSIMVVALFAACLMAPADSNAQDDPPKTTKSFSLEHGKNAISMPLADTGIATAQQLAEAVEGVQSIWQWVASDQAYRVHEEVVDENGSLESDFDILPGDSMLVEMAPGETATLSLTGYPLPALVIELLPTDTTNVGMVAVPLYRTDLTTAEQLANEIPYCDAVWLWDTAKDGYIGHPKGTDFNRNLSVEPGRSYFVSVTEETDWRQTGLEGAENDFTIEPGETFNYRFWLANTSFEGLQHPLLFEIASVSKDGVATELPEGVDFDEQTGAFSWRPTADQKGEYAFSISVNDPNVVPKPEELYISVQGGEQLVSDASAAPVFFTPANNETTEISYTLVEDATVSIDIYKVSMAIDDQGNGEFQKRSKMTIATPGFQTAGNHTATWNGKDVNGDWIEPSAYAFAIKAITDAGEESVWDLAYHGGSVSISEGAVVDPDTGDPADAFNPYAGETVEIRYNLFQSAWVTIGGENMRGFALEGAVRRAGNRSEWWDGKNTIGEVVANGDVLALSAKAEILPENAIVVQAPRPPGGVIGSLTAEPYVMTPSYGDAAVLHYTLSEDAQVEIRISDTRGNLWVHQEKTATTAGDHESRWTGVNADNQQVWPWSRRTAPGAGGPQEDFTVEIIAYDHADDDVVLDRKRTNIHAYR